jgi:hypothetical protein
MKEFIAKRRADIDAVIVRVVGPEAARLNDDERELWVLNNEELYQLALDAKVDGLE